MNGLEMYNMYQKEKAAMCGPTEEFPTFKVWKAEYLAEKEPTVTVDIESAIAEADKIVEEAEQELAAAEKVNNQTGNKDFVDTKKAERTTITKKKVSKKQLCVDIYKSMMDGDKHPVRKEVLARFKSEVNMTDAGAGTYWFNIKKELSSTSKRN